MENIRREVACLADAFRDSRQLLQALGDETRQHLMLTMMQMGQCRGVRVGTIAQAAQLSRPAVSHHLKILREAGVVGMRREGTRNYYYFDADRQSIRRLITMLESIDRLMMQLPDRSGDDE